MADPKEIDVDKVTPERWLPVVGYEENYLVSNRGRVWSTPRATTRGGLMKLQRARHGYWLVGLSLNGKQKTHKVHMLVLEAFEGPQRPGMITRHLNGNPGDNRWPENIRWGTMKENGADMVRHGRAYARSKTHCPQNHEYTPENTRYGSKGERVCKICWQAAMRKGQAKYQARKRTERLALLRDTECETCGALFTPRKAGTRFCSRRCRPSEVAVHGLPPGVNRPERNRPL